MLLPICFLQLHQWNHISSTHWNALPILAATYSSFSHEGRRTLFLLPHEEKDTLCASVEPDEGTPSKIRRLAALFDAAGDEGVKLLEDCVIHRRLAVFRQRLFPQRIGPLPGDGLARRSPLLKIAPIGNQRRIKGIRIAAQCVLGAEEMSAGADLADRFQTQRILAHVEGLEKFEHHLHEIDIEEEFLVGRDEATLHPAEGVKDQIAPAHDRS